MGADSSAIGREAAVVRFIEPPPPGLAPGRLAVARRGTGSCDLGARVRVEPDHGHRVRRRLQAKGGCSSAIRICFTVVCIDRECWKRSGWRRRVREGSAPGNALFPVYKNKLFWLHNSTPTTPVIAAAYCDGLTPCNTHCCSPPSSVNHERRPATPSSLSRSPTPLPGPPLSTCRSARFRKVDGIMCPSPCATAWTSPGQVPWQCPCARTCTDRSCQQGLAPRSAGLPGLRSRHAPCLQHNHVESGPHAAEEYVCPRHYWSRTPSFW